MSSQDLYTKPEYRALKEAMESEIADIHEKYAEAFLTYLRSVLAPFNTKRHKIIISSGMGMSCIYINGKALHDHCWGLGSHKSAVFDMLSNIEYNLDWPWAAYLHGKPLN